MERLFVSDVSDLAQYMVQMVDDNLCVTATLFFDDATELMREILSEYNFDIGYIQICSSEYNNYDGEYYLTLTKDGRISVEPACVDGKYKLDDSDVMLIDGDASYDIVKINKNSEFREICFGIDEDNDEYECCCDCRECHLTCGDDKISIDVEVDNDDELIERFYELLDAIEKQGNFSNYIFII